MESARQVRCLELWLNLQTKYGLVECYNQLSMLSETLLKITILRLGLRRRTKGDAFSHLSLRESPLLVSAFFESDSGDPSNAVTVFECNEVDFRSSLHVAADRYAEKNKNVFEQYQKSCRVVMAFHIHFWTTIVWNREWEAKVGRELTNLELAQCLMNAIGTSWWQ